MYGNTNSGTALTVCRISCGDSGVNWLSLLLFRLHR